MSDYLKKLAALFEQLPGIGPRQAARFAYSLLDEKEEVLKEMSAALLNLKSEVKRCAECFRVFDVKKNKSKEKNVCLACLAHRSPISILIVEKDIDLENIEKLGIYDGRFYVLGGVISPFNGGIDKIRLQALYRLIKNSPSLKEIILATSATSEGDATASYLEKIFEEFTKTKKIKISRLGRGLSTGSYLEFSDRDTLKNALNNRK
ncbi:MAG: recombination protein RecR [Candidatus Niyogibacteria bacterium]|nr:recombination protein RecR [Candidatus Niyogibacteria bacterium]